MITIELKPWGRAPDTHMQLRVDSGDQHFTWVEIIGAKNQLNSMALAYAAALTRNPVAKPSMVRFFP